MTNNLNEAVLKKGDDDQQVNEYKKRDRDEALEWDGDRIRFLDWQRWNLTHGLNVIIDCFLHAQQAVLKRCSTHVVCSGFISVVLALAFAVTVVIA